MYLSIGRKLKGLGGIRFGKRVSGSTAWAMLIVYGMLNLCWYCILGSLWMCYGIGYVCFYLPIKGISKLVKYFKEKNPRK